MACVLSLLGGGGDGVNLYLSRIFEQISQELQKLEKMSNQARTTGKKVVFIIKLVFRVDVFC